MNPAIVEVSLDITISHFESYYLVLSCVPRRILKEGRGVIVLVVWVSGATSCCVLEIVAFTKWEVHC